MSAYRVAPIFLIRIAGAPFDVIEGLATPKTISAGRALIEARKERARAGAEAENFFRTPERLLSEEAFRALHSAVRGGRVPRAVTGAQPSVFTNYARAAAAVADAETTLTDTLERELQIARQHLWNSARNLLPPYLVFGGSGVRELFATLSASENAAHTRRNARAGDRERHLTLYLQRIATKNDTFSEFGPTIWGSITRGDVGVEIAVSPGIARREAFLERWTADAVAAAINADAETFAQGLPRLHPNGRIDGQTFVAEETGERIPLSADELEIIARCDGKAPAYRIEASTELIRRLAERGVLRCEMEVPALEPHAFEVIGNDVESWGEGAARQKWQPLVQALAQLPAAFASATEAQVRQELLGEARSCLQALGAAPKIDNRSLYSAVNPIGEECARQGEFRIAEELIDQVAADAAPWVDLWRDSYAFIASRVAEGLREVFHKTGPDMDVMPLPAFLRACETAKLPLTGPGLVVLASLAFQEVKAAFRERLQPHADEEEYELSLDDCHVVRNSFEYPRFDEYTYPSADLQLAAESSDAVARGDYRWLLAELHPPVALLHHCMYWSCPDDSALKRAFASSVFGKPNFHFGVAAADFTAHTAVRLFDGLPDVSYFVAPQRGNPKWRTVRPADAEAFIDHQSGDVGVRTRERREYIGSFARAWVIPLGFHPFQFALTPHTPRLRCGRVVVQRRAWTVGAEEMPRGNYTGISRDLVAAIEQLRAAKNWPRHIYIRPTEQSLRRSGAEGRDKDTKPVFIDLESYLFLEIFHRWLVKAGELEVTEMLPRPEQLLWRESDGRRTFEMRTLIVPRS